MPKRTCSVDGCDSPSKTRGFCNRHYLRWWKYGSVDGFAPTRDFTDGTRVCSSCNVRQSLADEFYEKDSGRLGRRADCKTCVKSRSMSKYLSDPEKFAVSHRHWREKNKDSLRAKAREAYKKNPERWIEHAKNREHRIRALKHSGRYEAGITVKRLQARDGSLCTYCKRIMTFDVAPFGAYTPLRATIEHILPISRGGDHTLINTALACWECNCERGCNTSWKPRIKV